MEKRRLEKLRHPKNEIIWSRTDKYELYCGNPRKFYDLFQAVLWFRLKLTNFCEKMMLKTNVKANSTFDASNCELERMIQTDLHLAEKDRLCEIDKERLTVLEVSKAACIEKRRKMEERWHTVAGIFEMWDTKFFKKRQHFVEWKTGIGDIFEGTLTVLFKWIRHLVAWCWTRTDSAFFQFCTASCPVRSSR